MKDSMEYVNSDAPNFMTLDPDLLRLFDLSAALQPRSIMHNAFIRTY